MAALAKTSDVARIFRSAMRKRNDMIGHGCQGIEPFSLAVSTQRLGSEPFKT